MNNTWVDGELGCAPQGLMDPLAKRIVKFGFGTWTNKFVRFGFRTVWFSHTLSKFGKTNLEFFSCSFLLTFCYLWIVIFFSLFGCLFTRGNEVLFWTKNFESLCNAFSFLKGFSFVQVMFFFFLVYINSKLYLVAFIVIPSVHHCHVFFIWPFGLECIASHGKKMMRLQVGSMRLCKWSPIFYFFTKEFKSTPSQLLWTTSFFVIIIL
jgi:hypothetical protein